MVTTIDSRDSRKNRHIRIRNKVSGTTERPRLCVFRSLRYIYAQIVDDRAGRTLVSASSLDPDIKSLAGSKTENAKAVGTLLAGRASEKDIKQVVFDRGGYKYHGRVKSLADAAREAGLNF
ncbi:MAG: 50S ribosomal protein L18 [Chloroflexota bacterium]|nr:50S ribosomal protein L18 [Chloroflexota bacterium]